MTRRAMSSAQRAATMDTHNEPVRCQRQIILYEADDASGAMGGAVATRKCRRVRSVQPRSARAVFKTPRMATPEMSRGLLFRKGALGRSVKISDVPAGRPSPVLQGAPINPEFCARSCWGLLESTAVTGR